MDLQEVRAAGADGHAGCEGDEISAAHEAFLSHALLRHIEQYVDRRVALDQQ
jgi:hypothetical protein